MNELFALNLNDEQRIMSVTYDRYAPEDQPRVDHLPDGDISDYKYIDQAFVYDPMPIPPKPEPEPSQMDRIEAQALYTAMMTNTLLEV